MEGLKVIELDDEFVIIREYAYQKPEKVIGQIVETYADGTQRIIKEWEEWRKPNKQDLCEDIYIFTKLHLEKMEYNFKLGNCPITQKGLRRYSLAYGSGDNWYGCPARTAKQMLKKGVAVPKEVYGLFTHI